MNLQSQAAATGWRSDYQIGLDEGRAENAIDIIKLEAQLADAQQVNQWQPIETAPKDGQLIFLWNPKEPAVSKFGKWARHLETSHFCWTSPKNISYSNLPTHWMPLPAAPAIAEGKA